MRSAVCPKSLDHAELHFRVSFLIRIPDNAGSSFTVAAKETRTTFVLFRLANGNAQVRPLIFMIPVATAYGIKAYLNIDLHEKCRWTVDSH